MTDKTTQSLKPYLRVDTYPPWGDKYPVRIKSFFCDDEGIISGTLDNPGPAEHEVIFCDDQKTADSLCLSLRRFIDKVNARVQPNSQQVSPNGPPSTPIEEIEKMLFGINSEQSQ